MPENGCNSPMRDPTHQDTAGARQGARLVLAALALTLALAGCETGPEVVQNGVAACIASNKLPARYGEPFCRCLGDELERRFSYAEIRQYRLATDNWSYFVPVAGDRKFMMVPQVCMSRHVPEQYR